MSFGWCSLTYTGQASSAHKEKKLLLRGWSLSERKAIRQKKEDFMLDKLLERDKDIV